MYKKTLQLVRLTTLHFLIRPTVHYVLNFDAIEIRKHLKRQNSEDVARTTIFWLPLLVRPI